MRSTDTEDQKLVHIGRRYVGDLPKSHVRRYPHTDYHIRVQSTEYPYSVIRKEIQIPFLNFWR